MADKPEAPAAAETASAQHKAGSPMKLWIMMTGVSLVMAVGLSWALAEFVLLPKLKGTAPEAGAHTTEHATEAVAETTVPTPPPAVKGGEKKGGHGESEGVDTRVYTFNNVVVNLSGSMGTRYLKVSFTVTGTRTDLAPLMDSRYVAILDTTINALSSLTLADLEEPGAKNLIRTRLISNYNDLFKAKIVEQLYFSEFVIQ